MKKPLEDLLKQKLEIDSETADALAELTLTNPDGLFDQSELENPDDHHLALLAGIVAASRRRVFAEALKPIVDFVSSGVGSMDTFNQGRFWHLKAYAAWRIDDSILAAHRGFGRSIDLLSSSNSPESMGYLARVMDTQSQVLHQQGLLRDARWGFEKALELRKRVNDKTGTAISLGNLGRLCMELGEFEAAESYLTQDLEIVRETSPGLIEVQTQLLSHMGTCALEMGKLKEANQLFNESHELARSVSDATGEVFATLGMVRVALCAGETSSATTFLNTVQSKLSAGAVREPVRKLLETFATQLSAEMLLKEGNSEAAGKMFEIAREGFVKTGGFSPVEMAQLLRAYSQAAEESGDRGHSADLLKEALQRLDPTNADALRESIESDLDSLSRELRLLYSAGRVIGHDHIEFLLGEAGRSGFRGQEQEVAILFSDIRGFTSISELFTPEQLIVFLNDYLGHMTRCVQDFGGMVDKFIGDAVVAIFSLPTPQEDDAERAMLSALMMQVELARFNRRIGDVTRDANGEAVKLQIGIGLHTGKVAAGLIGSPQKRSYTVIGDAVNTSSRLESMTKQLGAAILVSSEIIERLPNPDRFLFRPLGRYQAKGKSSSITVFDLMGEDDGSQDVPAIRTEIDKAEEALTQLQQRRFSQAQKMFEALEASSEDTHKALGYRFLADAATAFLREFPSEENWNGSIAL